MVLKLPLIFLVAFVILGITSKVSAEPDLSLPHSINPSRLKYSTQSDFTRLSAPLLAVQQTPTISLSKTYILVQDDFEDIVIPVEIFYQLNWVIQVTKFDCNYLIALEPNTGILRAFKLPLNWLGYKQPRFIPSQYKLNDSFLLQFDTDELLDLQSGTVIWGNHTGEGLDYLPVTISRDLKTRNLINPQYVVVTYKDVPQVGKFNTQLEQDIAHLDHTKSKLILNYKDKNYQFDYAQLKANGMLNVRLSGTSVMLCYFPAVDLCVAFENLVRFNDYSIQKFDFRLTDNGLQDADSSSLWDRHGKCINGRKNMQGLKLYRIDSYLKFDFN